MPKKCIPRTISGPRGAQAVIYARVSSKEQEKEGFSIPAQLKLLKEYAAAQGFTVAQEYVDVETAKQAGRAAFGEMIAYLKGHPAVRTLLVEKTDRLHRKVHARHQGADGEELHRQSVGGGAEGNAGEGRAGHLADRSSARIPECG